MSESDISNSPQNREKTYSRRTAVTVEATQTRILKNDPKRLAFTIINQGVNNVRISNRSTITSSTGLQLVATGTMNFLTLEERAFVKSEINAISEVGSNIVEIFEELRY